MKLLLTILGIMLDLVWTVVATIVLGCVCIAMVDFLFVLLPQRLARRFKKLRDWWKHGFRYRTILHST